MDRIRALFARRTVTPAQTELEAARQRFSDDRLDHALKAAWDMLVAAEHPAAASGHAKHARQFVAQAIVRAARTASDTNALQLAGVDAFRFTAFPYRRANEPPSISRGRAA